MKRMSIIEEFTIPMVYGNFRNASTIALRFQCDDEFGRRMSHDGGFPSALPEGQRMRRKMDDKLFKIVKIDKTAKRLWIQEEE